MEAKTVGLRGCSKFVIIQISEPEMLPFSDLGSMAGFQGITGFP